MRRSDIKHSRLSFSVTIIELVQLMKIGQKILGKGLFGFLMKQTFYGHFVAGADQDGIKPNIDRMHSFGVKSILDYSVEVDESEQKKEEKKVFKTKKVLYSTFSDTPTKKVVSRHLKPSPTAAVSVSTKPLTRRSTRRSTGPTSSTRPGCSSTRARQSATPT